MQHSSATSEQLQRTWLRGGILGPEAAPALVVFPHAGGGASFYRPWLASSAFSVRIVQYPGHEDRISEQSPASLEALADGVAEALLASGERPLCLLGHSMGAIVAFEVARRLESAQLFRQLRLCVSSYTAPSVAQGGDMGALDEETVIGHARAAAGETSAFEIPELRDLAVSGMRADLRLLAQYRPGPNPRVAAPILALRGAAEGIATEMDAWAEATSGSFRSVSFPGGHFYLAEEKDAVLDAVRRWCRELDYAAHRGAHDDGGRPEPSAQPDVRDDDVAVIGCAARVPGAKDLDEFWANLCAGTESLTHFSDDELLAAGATEEQLADPRLIRARPTLADVADFDVKFFGYAPSEARLVDPQQRLFLECAWEAVESAGYDLQRYRGALGVFAGGSGSTYREANLRADPGNFQAAGYLQTTLSVENDFLAPRVSYKLNLRGPSISLGTGCSTALVAIHLAVQSVLSGESDMALAGGASITFPQNAPFVAVDGGAISTTGRCRAFDAGADGTLTGDGVGAVLLKRAVDALADGDHILGLIRGTAVNNDGGNKAGFAAPSIDGQADVVAEALGVAEVPAETIDYVETHGTGTPMGDPIEVAALSEAFRRAGDTRTAACRLGTLKPNIGHTGPASGVLGLIKVLLAFRHRTYPPAINFTVPNPQIDFAQTPFYVGTSLRHWDAPGGKPRRAGVSAYSMGGTNAHVVLQEPPAPRAPAPDRVAQGGPQLLVLSARTAAALTAARRNLAGHLARHPEQDLAAVAATLRLGRRAFRHRFATVATTSSAAQDSLNDGGRAPARVGVAADKPAPVAFLFPGQGSQFSGMGAQLYAASPAYRSHVDECAARFEPLIGMDLRSLLRAPEDASAEALLGQTRLAQPALFTVEYALAQLLREWGAQPAALLGHSIGEVTAACVAGVFTLADAVELVSLRGKLIQECGTGAMAAVGAPLETVAAMLPPGTSVAAVNAPEQIVVAGSESGIGALLSQAAAAGVRCTRLPVEHGFHSALVDPAAAQFAAVAARIRLRPPQIPFLSNVTGAWITGAQATDPEYWGRQLRAAVQFAPGLARLRAEHPDSVLVEVGPGHTLRGLVAVNAPGAEVVPMLGGRSGDSATVATAAAGQLWVAGSELSWQHFAQAPQPREPLPTYPFQRERCWLAPSSTAPDNRPVQPQPAPAAPRAVAGAVAQLPVVDQIWCEALGVESVAPQDNFFDLGGNSLIAACIVAAVKERCHIEISVAELWDQGATLADLADLVKRRRNNATETGEEL